MNLEAFLLISRASSLNQSYFTKTNTTTFCPWKGTASYYTINVDGEAVLTFGLWTPAYLFAMLGTKLQDAAWYYPEPKEKAANIKDHVAFCKWCTNRVLRSSMLTAR